MSFYRLESKLQRSKSTGALDALDSHCINYKSVKSFANQCPSNHEDLSAQYETLLDSLNKSQSRILDLEQKNRKLNGMVEQQQNILKVIKEDLKISYRNNIIGDLVQDSTKTVDEIDSENTDCSGNPQNKQARSLLAAIAPKHTRPDVDMSDALTKFEIKFGSQGLRDRNAITGTKDALLKPRSKVQPPDVIWKSSIQTLNNDVCDKETPPERWSEKFNFVTFEPRDFFRGPMQTSTLNNHPLSLEMECFYAEEFEVPPSPPQPTDPEVSIIDHLMLSAVINKKISEGDLNGSFEEALSHCNLALVMGACRAVDPAQVFSPCCLSQAVLLSLVQQLATDMVHETQLKCRYLEEALLNLDVSDEVTRAHLPLVVGEVRKHLSKFVRLYPHHVANRRISLIIMAADNTGQQWFCCPGYLSRFL